MNENKETDFQRDSFVFYRSFCESIQEIPDKDERLSAYESIFNYALNGIEPDNNGYAKAIFTLIKPQLDANNKRWKNGKKGAEHGKKGGRPKTETQPPNQTQDNPTLTPNKDKDANKNDNANEELILSTIVDCKNPLDLSHQPNEKVEYQRIIDLFNKTCISLSKVTKLSEIRKRKIKTRVNEIKKHFPESNYFDILKEIFTKIEKSSFLKGEETNWKACFDWIFANGSNWLKIYEGNFTDKNHQENGTQKKEYIVDIRR